MSVFFINSFALHIIIVSSVSGHTKMAANLIAVFSVLFALLDIPLPSLVLSNIREFIEAGTKLEASLSDAEDLASASNEQGLQHQTFDFIIGKE